MFRIATIGLLALTVVASPLTLAQRSGQSAKITVGKVEQAQRVQLDSNAGRGALVGGALGWAATRNRSSSSQALGALGGAAAGGAIANRSQGDRTGMQYVIRTGQGSAITVVTDQTEIRIGDCVIVEETSNGANVRRTDPTSCEPESQQAVAELADEMQEEAAECDAAKQELLSATTAEQVDIAQRKMQILCNS